MKSSMKRSGFGFQTWKFQKPPKSLILEWLRRIHACLPVHFHILNLFISLWNLGFDQATNGHKIKKNQKNEKQKHIVFILCHIVSIQVDKQGLDISKPDKSCSIYPLSILWSLAWREVVLGFKHGNFKNIPKASF